MAVKRIKEVKVKKPSLPADVAEKYKLHGITPGRYGFPGFGEYDLTTIDLITADRLFSRGFPWLKLKKPPTSS